MALIIPRQHKPIINEILGFDAPLRSQILENLGRASPTLDLDKLAVALRKDTSLSPSSASRIVPFLLSLYSVPNHVPSVSRDSLIEELLAAVAADEAIDADEEQVEEFKGFLAKALEASGPFPLSFRALNLMASYGNFASGIKILSDLRPVFDTDVGDDESPAAFVIKHSLCIFYQEGNERKEIVLAIDDDYIDSMIRAGNRAKLKEASLKSVSNAAGIPILD